MKRENKQMKRLTPIKAIREKCMECSNQQYSEVTNCPILDCALYSYRFGKNPSLKGKRGNGEGLKKYQALKRGELKN